ncbi:hypothetical protein NFI96_006352 [Prochilodus magdalenae]|nr:hypothetical protein NFI96_006352 [Prochilodus magdalenae]
MTRAPYTLVLGLLITVNCTARLLSAGRRTRPKPHRQDQVKESSSVLYAALNIRKPQNRTDPAEISPQTDAACPTDSGVLYSDVRLKVPKQKHTPPSDQT